MIGLMDGAGHGARPAEANRRRRQVFPRRARHPHRVGRRIRAPRCSASRRRGAPASGMVRYLGPPSADLARAAAAPRDGDRRRPRAGVADRVGNGCRATDRMPRPRRCAASCAAPLPVVVDAGALDLAPARDGAADRHAARARARAPAGAARARRDAPATDDAARAASALETAAALGATVVLKGVGHDRRVAGRLGDGSRRRERRGSRRPAPATCSPARSARSSPARRTPTDATTSARSRPPASGCTAAPARLAAADLGPGGGPITALDVADGAPARRRRGALDSTADARVGLAVAARAATRGRARP